MKRVSIVGGSGYAAGELLRLLTQHPQVALAQVTSRSQAGRPLQRVHRMSQVRSENLASL